MRIRPAAPEEIPPVAALLTRSGLPVAGIEELWQTWVAVDDQEGGGSPGVVVGEEQLLGCAGLERHGEAYLLRSIAVRSDARGSGVGAALVAAALDAVPDGRPVALLTETASGWFPRFGFHPVPRTELDPALHASVELTSACPQSAQAFFRPPPAPVMTT